MIDRWKMHRIGFVNFWLYDNESFEFEDGKLLLRGQNGSGKSITTQSFIPFILDGDRTPSRLDPFGSGDRRMEYYFLGDGDKEESTGYLYLEFKKPESKEYRTICIGQTAHKGRPMSFWGFVLNDNRRIGKDVQLFRKSGDVLLPFSRLEMKRELGEKVPFTTSQLEYKEMVNQYLFDFGRIEQYEQYIKLLIKVRAPKLSKEFKPTKVYEILNESLQVLSDEDLRAMVEAMEKMDSIQEGLEKYKRAYDNALTVEKEYDHYNRYVLSKKAHRFLDAEQKKLASEKQYEEEVRKVEQWKLEVKTCESRLEQCNVEAEFIRKTLEQLANPELENLDRRLQNEKKELEETISLKDKKIRQIQDKQDQIHDLEVRTKQLQDSIESVCDVIQKKMEDMDLLQEDIQCEVHAEIKERVALNKPFQKENILANLSSLETRLKQGKEALSKTEQSQRNYEIAKEKENKSITEYQEIQNQYEQLTEEKEHQQDALLNTLELLKGFDCWKAEETVLQQAAEIIQQYDEVSDSVKLRDVLKKDFDEKVQEKREKLAQIQAACKQLVTELKAKSKEYADLENQKEIEPVRDTYAQEAREQLKLAGITAMPFYQTVDFAQDLDESQQAILEQQLYKSGILDALVVSKEGYQRIQKEFPSLLDSLIISQENGTGDFHDLCVDTSIPEDIQKEVQQILSNITSDHGTLVLDHSGYYRHGMIEGYVTKEHSEYIGATARKRYKEALLLEINHQMDALKQSIEENRSMQQHIHEILDTMKKEFSRIPDTSLINEIISSLLRCNAQLDTLLQLRQQCEAETNKAYDVFKSYERAMLAICNTLPYTRSTVVYEEILKDIEDYKSIFYDISEKLVIAENQNYEIVSKQDAKDRCFEEIDTLSLEKDKFVKKQEALKISIQQIQETMDSPETKELARKLTEAHKKEEENALETKKTTEALLILRHDLEAADDITRKLQADKEEHETAFAKFKEFFEEEVSLGFLLDSANTSLEILANQAIALEEPVYLKKAFNEMTTKLYEVFQKNTSDLSEYSPKIVSCFEGSQEERTRSLITASWLGKTVQLKELQQQLSSIIEEQKELIQQKDRELFEDILSQTISKKLTERIDESRNWVREMSSLMKKMNTSMGMHFTLEWKPKNPDSIEEMDVRELEKILTKDTAMVSSEDEERVARHFRSIIQKEKQRQEMSDEVPDYMTLVRNALDYRKWYEFKMSYVRNNEGRKDLTNAAFNRFSGGEKAMAMYVPLFAAVNAQYKKARLEDHPRIIALDEAFAGVDEKNIASMFEMVEQLDFDYIMNSQALWGCYATVKRLKISELLRPLNANYVTVINYIWNGKERIVHER